MYFLRKAVADAPFRRIWRESLDSLQDLLFHDVILKHDFSTHGAAQLKCDIEAIQTVIDGCIKYESGSSLSMPKLKEAVDLLNIPVKAEDGQKTLKEIGEAIFAGGLHTQMALQDLGMVQLTNG